MAEERSIRDFGGQESQQADNGGHYGSLEPLADDHRRACRWTGLAVGDKLAPERERAA